MANRPGGKPLSEWQRLLRGLAEAGFVKSAWQKGIKEQQTQVAKAKGVGKIMPYLRESIRKLSPVGMISQAPEILAQAGKEFQKQTPLQKAISIAQPLQSPLGKQLITEPAQRAIIQRPVGLVAPSVYPTVEKLKQDPIMEIMDEMMGLGIVGGAAKLGTKARVSATEKVLGKELNVPSPQQPLPGFGEETILEQLRSKLAEETGAIGEKPKFKGPEPEIPKPKATPEQLKNSITMDARDFTTDYGSTEQLHLPLEGPNLPRLKEKPPKAMQEYLKGAPIKASDYLEPGIGNIFRPTRKIFARLGSDLYHAVKEPFTMAERARYSWVRKRLEEQQVIWKGVSKLEDERINIAGDQRYNVANGLDLNFDISKKMLGKYGVGENPIKLTPREEGVYSSMRNWFDTYQKAKGGTVRPSYWPGIKDFDAIDRAIRTMYPTGELPNDIISFAARLRKDTSNIPRETSSISKIKKYINAEANDRFYGRLMAPTKQIVSQLNEAGKTEAANYVQNYAERMVGFPGKMDRNLINWTEGMDRMLGVKNPNPQRALRVSQTVLDMQYLGGLGGKPSTAIRNLAQLINTASEVGYKWSAEGVIRFLKHPKQSVNLARKAGLIEQVIPDIELKGNLMTNRMDRLKNDMLWMFEKTENTNRAITMEAATAKFESMWKRYGAQGNLEMFRKKADFAGLDKPIIESIDKLINKGQLGKAKQQYARELTANTQYLYQKGESPLVTRTQLGKQAWIFQTWWENYAEMMANWAKHGQWKNFIRHIGATAGAIEAAKLLGFDIRTWVGPSPFPDPFGGRFPIETPAIQTGKNILDVAMEAAKAPMYPEKGTEALKGSLKTLGRGMAIFAPGGILSTQLYDIATGKKKPIELLASIPKPRTAKQIRQDMVDVNAQYNKGLISTADRDKQFIKLRKEFQERKKQSGQ